MVLGSFYVAWKSLVKEGLIFNGLIKRLCISAGAVTCLLTNTGDKIIIGMIMNTGEDRMEQTVQQTKTDRIKNRYLRAFKAAFPYTIPVLTGFAALGIAYGLLMASNGYGVLWALLMSAIGF